MNSTRDQLLSAARTLFAERGFYGVSIAQIADALGLTKQALLHHFPSKEKLYDEVLQHISDELADLGSVAHMTDHDPVMWLRDFFQNLVARTPTDVARARLIMRELLDNKVRAESVHVWRLKPFVDGLVEKTKSVPEWSRATDAQARALVYQLLGAVNYYAVSGPTLRGLFGDDDLEQLDESFAPQIDALVSAALGNPPG